MAANGKKEYQLLVKIMGQADPSLFKATGESLKNINQLKAGVGVIDDALWGGLKKTIKFASRAAAVAGVAATAGLKKAYDTGTEFEKHMDQWAATADANQAEYDKAREAAMYWGRRSTRTAIESADALNYMALAGWDVNKSISALPGVLKLSEATQLDLARTSDLVTDSMAATGTGVKDLTRFLDVAAKANNKSNQTAEQLMEAWIKSGSTLNNLNVSIEDSATAFGILANRGRKAEQAGTSLNSTIINLTTGSGQAGKAMHALGVSAFDNEGKFKGLKEVLLELHAATKDLSEEEKNRYLSMIGGKRQVQTLNNLMQGATRIVKDGKTEWELLNEELNNSVGALDRMAAVRMDNLAGDVKILQSALQDASIRAYDGITEPMRDAAQLATKAVYTFSEEVSDRIGTMYPTIKRNVTEATEPILNFGKFLVGNGPQVVSVLSGIVASIATLHGIRKTDDLLTKVLGSGIIGTALSGPAIAGITALVGAMAAVSVAGRKMFATMQKTDLAKHFGSVSMDIRQIRQMSKSIIGEDLFSNIIASGKEVDNLKATVDGIREASDEVSKLTWKVQHGLELTESDQGYLSSYIDRILGSSDSVVNSANYLNRLNVAGLFGEDSPLGDRILGSMTSFTDSLAGKMNKAKEELSQAYIDALADGVMDAKEAKLIDSLIAKYNSVTGQLANYQTQAAMSRVGHSFTTAGVFTAESFRGLIDQLHADSIEVEEVLAQQRDYIVANQLAQLDNNNLSMLEKAALYSNIEEANKAYDDRMAELANRRTGVVVSSLAEAYGEDVKAAVLKVQEMLSDPETYGGVTAQGYEAIVNAVLPKGTQLALKEIIDEIGPEIDDLRKQRDALGEGETLPEALAAQLNFAEMIEGLVSGEESDLWAMVNEKLLTEESYNELITSAKNGALGTGPAVSEGMVEGINGIDQSVFVDPANLLVNKWNLELSAALARNPVNFTPNINVNGVSLPQRAEGGIITRPEIAMVAEAGYPEAIIPINNSARAAQLYEETGRMLGMSGTPAGGGGNFSFNFTINGNADESTLRAAANRMYEQFTGFMARYQRDNARLAY